MGSEGVPERARGQNGYRHHGDPCQERIRGEQDGGYAHDAQQRHAALFGSVDEDALDRIDVLDDARH